MKNELFEIFEYWISRNKSNSFDIKLNNIIEDQLNILSASVLPIFHKIGRTKIKTFNL